MTMALYKLYNCLNCMYSSSSEKSGSGELQPCSKDTVPFLRPPTVAYKSWTRISGQQSAI